MKKTEHRDILIWGILSAFIVITVLLFSQKGGVSVCHPDQSFLPPSIKHLFGTDYMGRDLFLRTMTGFKNTFLVAVLTLLIPYVLGAFIGSFLGYFGGTTNEAVFHLLNILLAFPSILSAIFLSVYFGSGIWIVVFIFSVHGLVHNIKLVRSEIGQAKNNDFVIGLRLNGISEWRIFLLHMLPRGFYILLPLMPVLIGHSMVGISSFSFLGLGVQPPTPELGIILKDALRFAGQAPWMIIFPGIFQFLCVLVFTFFSESCERALQRKSLGEGHE